MVEPYTNYPNTDVVVPRVVYGEGVQAEVYCSPEGSLQPMDELGINPDSTDVTAYLAGGFNLARKGMQLSKRLDRFVHGPLERNEGNGYVVRINTKLRGRPRTAEEMNRTYVHELTHVAQAERNDPRVPIGNAIIGGLTIAGMIAGSVLARKSDSRIAVVAAVAFGGMAGHDIGYKLAPHEREAHRIAETVTSHAIQRV